MGRVALQLAVLLVGACAFAKNDQCESIWSSRRLTRAGQPMENAAEIEVDVNAAFIDLLTTDDGTINPLIASYQLEEFPELKKWLARRKGVLERWDQLPLAVKRNYFRAVGTSVFRSNVQRFWEDTREIPGLRMRSHFTPSHSTPFHLWGRLHAPGEETEMSFVEPRIEYASPSSMRTFSGAEIHVRAPLPAAQIYHESRQFLRVANLPPRFYIHMHVLANVPTREEIIGHNRQAGDERAALVQGLYNWALFLRNCELRAQVLAVESGGAVYNDDNSWTLTSESPYYNNLLNSLMDQYLGSNNPHLNFSKVVRGFTGPRGSATYDIPGLWGVEYRDLPYFADPSQSEKVLNEIESMLENQSYLTSKVNWGEWKRNNDVEGVYHDSAFWYLSEKLPAQLSLAFDISGFTPIQIFHFINRHFELGWLLHSWQYDPLFFEDPEAVHRIQRAQNVGLNAIEAPLLNTNPLLKFRELEQRISRVMRDFVRESGLLERLDQSFAR